MKRWIEWLNRLLLPTSPAALVAATAALMVMVTVMAMATVMARPGLAQDQYRSELAVIGAEVYGDWWEVRSLRTRSTVRIRIEPDGRFLHGTDADFGAFPSRWQARRLTLSSHENLIVRWADRGVCAYYVGLRIEDGVERMIWRPYRDERDFGAFDGIITRAVMPWGDCRPEEWSRLAPPPPKPIPDFPR